MLPRGGTVRRASLSATSRTRAGREHACRASWRRLPLTMISNTAAARIASPLRAKHRETRSAEGRREASTCVVGSLAPPAVASGSAAPALVLGLRRIFAHQETDEAYEEPKKSSDLIHRRTGYRGQSEHLCDLVQKGVVELSRCLGHFSRTEFRGNRECSETWRASAAAAGR